ncbi:MAG: FHA domain-containing protein [Actinobacteria bacterium]|nr:FHA domain-containing protein [Actinomycetota bacterium]
MLEPVLFGSKILFLVLLYLFIFVIVRRLSRDLRRGEEPIGMPARSAQAASPVSAPPPAPSARPMPAPAPAAPAASASGPAVVPVARPPKRSRERAPEAAPKEPDTSTREFDYLVTQLKPRLVVQHSKVVEDGQVFEVKGGATIGRSPRSQIVLPDDFVSSTHARIFARKQFLFLEDLGSTNGTFIDGRRIEGELQIKPGQEIVIGDTIFRFEE